MKKNYVKLKMMLVAIVFIIVVAGCSMLTYEKSVAVQQEYVDEVYEYMDILAGYNRDFNTNGVEEVCSDIVKQTYYNYYKINSIYYDMGFYSMLNDNEGNVLAHEQNFIIITKNNISSGLKYDDMRLILLGDESIADDWYGFLNVADNNPFHSIEIKGLSDDNFIYLDEFRFAANCDEIEHIYKPKLQVPSEGDLVSFESWAGGNTFLASKHNGNDFFAYTHATSFLQVDSEEKDRLNKEAKEACEKLYEAHRDGWNIMNYREDEGLLTTYVVNSVHISEEYSLSSVFVFHPIGIAMKELTSVYTMVGFFAICVIVAIWLMIDKVYKQQLAYENNRRELTRGIAHELKTPLAIVKGYVENWDYLDDDEREQSSKIMIDEIEHMDKMVTDLLELSHLEAKTKAVSLEHVDICSLTKSVLGRMKPIIEEKKLTVSGNIYSEEIEGKEYLVEADLEMMRIVLVNFISNAVKYADKEIDISLSDNGKKVGFKITNDGQTIEADNLCKVWDEFYRDATVDQKRIGGNGLGLAITKNILMLHRAKYGCKSEYGKTTFWFEMKYK